MVRDPSIVSPSLTGVFLGGGPNKHGLQDRGARCGEGPREGRSSSVVPPLLELFGIAKNLSPTRLGSWNGQILGFTRESFLSHPAWFPFRVSC